MPWVGEAYECEGRECRQIDVGAFWFQRRCRLWEEPGQPPPVEVTYDWINTGEPCVPGED